MTTEELIAEGRRLERPCAFLRSSGRGEVAAVWHSSEEAEPDGAGFRPWLSVDTRFIPGFDTKAASFLTILGNEEDCVTGRVDLVSSLPIGEALYAHPASVLPPIDAVIACGSPAIDGWLEANNWNRACRYNDNFPDSAIVRDYERLWASEFPLYFQDSDVFAVLGGWHWPNADGDWHDLIPEHLMAMTIRDSEPWVEAWQLQSREFRVIQRLT
jgi:hypothetical protein